MKTLALFLLIPAALFGVVQNAPATPVIDAYLYSPTAEQIVLQYPYNKPSEILPLKATLALHAEGLEDRTYKLHYAIETGGKKSHSGNAEVKVKNGRFDLEIALKEKFPSAKGISWRLVASGSAPKSGYTPLAWSRFHGQVRYKHGGWHSTYIELLPIGWGAPGVISVPVADDGTFDAFVPARVYAVVNVNGTGYVYDAMERWAWNYNLTRDREDLFTIGSMELYGMRAFHVQGGPNTLFVFFRPSTLARIHQFDSDGDKTLNESEMRALQEALKHSPTAIGPELKPSNIKVWLDGKLLPIAQLNQIPEASEGGEWQVDYLVQCLLPTGERPKPGVWHRVKLEVMSEEELRGQSVTDFGQGSVDVQWD